MTNRLKAYISSNLLVALCMTTYASGIPKLSKPEIQQTLTYFVATGTRSFSPNKPFKQGELIAFARAVFVSGLIPRKYKAKDRLLKGFEGGPYDVEIEKREVEHYLLDILAVKLTVWAYGPSANRWGMMENSSIMPYKFRKAKVARIELIGKERVRVAFKVMESGQELAPPIIGKGEICFIWHSHRWIVESFKTTVASSTR